MGANARVLHCGVIRNVLIGPHAEVRGTSLLDTEPSSAAPKTPPWSGEAVQAKHFIIAEGASVDRRRASLEKAFVGQGVPHRQAVLGGELRLLRQLRGVPRRGVLDLRRAVHGHAPQVDAADRRPCSRSTTPGQRHQPEQPHVQARPRPSGHVRARLQDRVVLVRAVDARRPVQRRDRQALQQLQHARPAVRLHPRIRGAVRHHSRHEPLLRRDGARRGEVAQAGRTEGGGAARPDLICRFLAVHGREDASGACGPAAPARSDAKGEGVRPVRRRLHQAAAAPQMRQVLRAGGDALPQRPCARPHRGRVAGDHVGRGAAGAAVGRHAPRSLLVDGCRRPPDADRAVAGTGRRHRRRDHRVAARTGSAAFRHRRRVCAG